MNERFLAAYATTPNSELAAKFGVSVPTIKWWAHEAGLKKTSAYRSQVQRQNSTGRVLSAESRAKISAKAKGRQLSAQTKRKILQTKQERETLPKGATHYKWKGGRPWERFKNPRYSAWRTAVLERDGYVCQSCQRQCKKYERGLAAHHVKSYADYPDLRYVVSNGITLCRRCHLALHGKAPRPKLPIPCACGCSTLIEPVDCYGRPRRFVNRHARRGQAMPDSAKRKQREQRAGKPLSPEHRAKIAEGLRSSRKRIGRPPKTRIDR